MIVNKNFVISDSFLPSHVCDDIVRLAQSRVEQDGVVQSGLDKTIRDSRVNWLDDTWIYDWINKAIDSINYQSEWNFHLSFPGEIQFTKYKENQFYGWHQDIYGKLNEGDHQRKISCVIPLVDSDQYEGGDLEFYDSMVPPHKKEEDKVVRDLRTRKKGTLIVFPSYVYHQVTKVTKGERLSIVIWYHGEKWK